MPVLSATAAINEAVAAAKSLPSLVANLHALDPDLAAQLEAKPLIASKSPWGTLAAAAIAWLSSRYGFGLDDATCSLVSGAVVLLVGYALRAAAKHPVAGLFSTPAAVPSAQAQVPSSTP